MSRLDQIRARVHDLERRHHGPDAAVLQRPVTAELRTDPQTKDGVIPFRGHAAVFDRLSHDLGGFREQIRRGAFRKALDANADVVALINHEAFPVLGRTLSGTLQLREDPRGLFTWIDAPADHPDIVHLRGAVDRGDVSSMSFGFSAATDEWTTDPDGAVVRTIHEFGELYDVSIVTFPAYPQTDVRTFGVDEEGDGAPEADPALGDEPPEADPALGDEPPTGGQGERTLAAAWCRRRLHIAELAGASARTNHQPKETPR